MNGLSSMSYHLRGLTLIMTLMATPGLAQTSAEDAAEPLTMEFLEFLSEWETDLGDWVGPSSFEDDSFDQLYEDNSEIDDDEPQP